jgi:spore coat protein H
MNTTARKRIGHFVCILFSVGMIFSVVSCGKASGTGSSQNASETDTATTESVTSVSKEEPDITTLKDRSELYTDADPGSVITMYLTVSSGNATEYTDHTWEEINAHSKFWYQERNIPKWGVNGLIQIGDENGPVSGSLGYGENASNATVYVRGNSSSQLQQKSYKIKIKDGRGTWEDQKIILLNKHQSDGLRFRNKLSYDLMTEVPGMISSRTQFVHLYVKDDTASGDGKDAFVDYGLYTSVEQPNKTYLKNHGLDSNGQLYKINSFEFYRYEDIIKLKSETGYDEAAFKQLLNIKGNDDHSKLIAMLDDLNNESMPIEDVLDKWFDEDNILTWLSFQILTGNLDTQSSNSLLYSPKNLNTWYFISWDNDACLFRKEDELRGNTDYDGWEIGISDYWGNVLFNRMLKSADIRAALDEKIEEEKEILTKEEIKKRIDIYEPVTRKFAFSAPDILCEPLSSEEYDEIAEELPDEIDGFYDAYKESLKKPMPFFIGVPKSTKSGFDFTWDPAYDFNAEDIHYSVELSKDLDFKKPIFKEDNLLMTEYHYKGELKEGQYFLKIIATNESGKSQYAFDYYVDSENRKHFGIYTFNLDGKGNIVTVDTTNLADKEDDDDDDGDTAE